MATKITKEEIKKEIKRIKNTFGIKNSVDDNIINALSNREGIQEISSAHRNNQLAWLFIDKIIYDALADRMTSINEMIDLFPDIIDFDNKDEVLGYIDERYKIASDDEGEFDLVDCICSIDEADGIELVNNKDEYYQISLLDSDDMQQLNVFSKIFYVFEDDFSIVCALVEK